VHLYGRTAEARNQAFWPRMNVNKRAAATSGLSL
jgi:hypothetical protein